MVVPVGTAWNRATETGVADPNPYDGLEAGKLGLSRADARALQQVAFDERSPTGAVTHEAQPPPAEGNPRRCDAR